ncbi:uncharacterized protein ACA1_342040 [Acanthamoeba castellanii str. Neff]|uniref:Uncharacterized protein n=1 Tax=Acanthamoeba castellanii (strain ATCC 30010 / Neff) TaxID=1257118 RepID=L8HD97_ACACF|nr:uncharacterized protein ACA1_342040 [Acanthamoeba castellanii str. Neff]ELR23140.1 hypothetical protein ACA1_342040 [Acanthamoeba castellanii str. Neff]
MQDDQGQTIKYQKTEAVECLLKAGTRTVDVNLQDKAGMTALHHASKESYREGTEQLLCCERIDVNVADSRGKTPQDYVVDDTIRDLFVERITTVVVKSQQVASSQWHVCHLHQVRIFHVILFIVRFLPPSLLMYVIAVMLLH